jgi:hypothetical protein
MLNRLTISALLKSVIVLMAACVVAFLVTTAWDSWGRLQTAGRISVIAEASANAFKAMHNLRTDRATTTQTLNAEAIDPDAKKTLSEYRESENPALRSVVDLAATVEFADQKTLLPALTRQFETLKALQTESMEAIAKPKASRRLALAKEYAETTTALLLTLEKLAAQLAAAVSHDDAVVDQLLAIKQLAWLVRTDLPPAACRRTRVKTIQNSSPARSSSGMRWRPWWRARNCRPACAKRWRRRRLAISSRNIWRPPSDC